MAGAGAFAASLCAVFLASACGGGGDRLSRQEYIRQADAVCKEYEGKLEAYEGRLEQASSPKELGQVIDDAIPTVKDGVDALRELEPPENLEPKVNDWLELNDKNIETLEQLRDTATEGDPRKLRETVEKGDDNERRADELAREIGLEACSQDD
jgi:hypothetical protein